MWLAFDLLVRFCQRLNWRILDQFHWQKKFLGSLILMLSLHYYDYFYTVFPHYAPFLPIWTIFCMLDVYNWVFNFIRVTSKRLHGPKNDCEPNGRNSRTYTIMSDVKGIKWLCLFSFVGSLYVVFFFFNFMRVIIKWLPGISEEPLSF